MHKSTRQIFQLITLSTLLAANTHASDDVKARVWPQSVEALAKMDMEDLFTQRWFDIEIVIFERLPVLDTNTDEALALEQPRLWPAGIIEFRDLPLESEQAAFAGQPADLDFVLAPLPTCVGYPELPVEDPIHPSRVEALDLNQFETLPEVDAPPEPVESLAEDDADPTTEAGTDSEPAAQIGIEPETPPPPTPYELFQQAVQDYEAQLTATSFAPKTDLPMITEVKALNRQRHLRPLIHTRWHQATPPRGQPQAVYLGLAATPQTPTTQLGEAMLEGYIAVTVSRYLHVDLHLWYHSDTLGLEPVGFPVDLTPGPPQRKYMELRERRRMRSDELHYLDHPKLGALIRISPVEVPETLTSQFKALAAGAE